MQSIFGHVAAVLAIAVTAVLFETGFMAPGDAFFAASAVLLLYTGHQLVARENQPLREAVVALFTQPRTHGGRGFFAAYVGTAVVGGVVVMQTLAYL